MNITEKLESLIAQLSGSEMSDLLKKHLMIKAEVEFDSTKFSDINDFLPFMIKQEDGTHHSNTLSVLTQRPTVYGKALAVCLGKVFTDLEKNELVWTSDDGEEVVGWMYLPSTANIDTDLKFRSI